MMVGVTAMGMVQKKKKKSWPASQKWTKPWLILWYVGVGLVSVTPSDDINQQICLTHSFTHLDTKEKRKTRGRNLELLINRGGGWAALDPSHNGVNMSAERSQIPPFKHFSSFFSLSSGAGVKLHISSRSDFCWGFVCLPFNQLQFHLHQHRLSLHPPFLSSAWIPERLPLRSCGCLFPFSCSSSCNRQRVSVGNC